jgi:superfamily II DNA or RNA helicase
MGDNPLLREDKDYTLNEDFPLRPQQNDGVHFLLSKFNGVLNHQTGLGKTFTSLTAAQHVMNYLDDTKTIIFCTKKANTSFEKELNEKIKKTYSKYQTDDIIENEDADYVIYNYMSMHKYTDEIADFINSYNIVAIIDEAHKLQNNGTRTSKILRNFRAGFSCKFLLTATPLLNDIQGLYNIVDYVKPDFLGAYKTFEKKYLITKMKWVKRGGRRVKYKKIMGEKNLDHLSKRLKSVVQVRKRNYNLEFHYRKVKMSESMKDEYIRAAMGIIDDDYEDGDIKDFAPRLHDLQRVVDNVQEEMEKESLSNKEKLLLKTSKEIIDRGEGLIVYVDYIDTEERLQELFEGYRDKIGFNVLHKITGSVGQEERNLVEEELANKDVVIITEAGSESINLRQVNNIVFYDLPFAVGTVIQCLTGGSRILTKDGYKKIKNIDIKDKVWTGFKWADYRILKKDKAEIYKVSFDSGREIKCSLDHKFKNEYMDWVEVNDLKKGDKVAKPYKNKFNFNEVDKIVGDSEKALIETNKDNIVWEGEDLLNLFYLAGYILGDGWITFKRRENYGGIRKYVGISFGYHEEKRKNRIKQVITDWGLTVSEQKQEFDDGIRHDAFVLSIYDYRLISALVKLGVGVNKRFDTKEIPDVMFKCSSKQRVRFIEGIFDSDGVKWNGSFHMNNKKLLQQLSLLLELEGIVSKVSETSGAWLLYLIGGRIKGRFKDILNSNVELKDSFVLEGDYYKDYFENNQPDLKENHPSWVKSGIKNIKKGKNISSDRIEKVCRYFDIDLRVLRGRTKKEICDRFFMVYEKLYHRKQPDWVRVAKHDMKRRNISYDVYTKLLDYYNIPLPDEWYMYDEVVDVEVLNNEEDVYYIEVDDKKHQYVADGYIHKNCIGRITRMDTEYDSQNVYFLEVEDTIDNYKRIMFQNNVSLIKELFGGNSNLPTKVDKVDKRLMKYVRKKLLWKFEEWKS